MKRIAFLWVVAALGACASAGEENTPSPADCARIVAQPPNQAAAGENARQMPRPLNPSRRQFERRLSDTLRSLQLDSVPRPAVLRWRLSAEGRPEQVSVKQSSGSPQFDAAAAWAMGFQEFAPARVSGCPVAVWIELPINPPIPPRRRAPARASGVQAPPRG